MKKTAKFFILFCFSAIILSGCNRHDTSAQPLSRVVTQVDIICRREHMLIQRHYTDTQKIESVLLYLRLLKPLGRPETDPDTVDRDIFEITVHLSDGNKRIYRQKAHRYFSKESRPWEIIDPKQAYWLYDLMARLPSDDLLAVPQG